MSQANLPLSGGIDFHEAEATAVSVMIATKNRLDELRRTFSVLLELNPPPLEILVTADGCADGTCDFVRRELPSVRLFVNVKSLGSVPSRSRMLREAKGDLVLAIDDDSYPEQRDCIARLVDLFASRPRLALAHFPQRSDEYPSTLAKCDFGPERRTNSYPNSGACYRRSHYVKLPGFYEDFFHMYEEPDYALQCLAAGYDVRFIPTITIRHHWSGHMRNEIRNHHLHARNEWWSIWLRCPWPYAGFLLVYRMATQLGYAYKRGLFWLAREPLWWWEAICGLRPCLVKRQPVPWAHYKKWLLLGRDGRGNLRWQ